MRTTTEKLAAALHVLANDIQSDDGVANAAILEAALRLEEQEARIQRLEKAGDKMEKLLPEGRICDEAVNQWRKAKEAKP